MTANKDWIGTSKSVKQIVGISLHGEERAEHDYYASPPIAAEWLCRLENLHKDIWECACGEGHLAKVFEVHGHNVRNTDLVDRGYGQGGVDFLQQTDKWHGDIVTNPPYKYALEFVKHALELVEDGNKVCMLLRLQFLEGKARRKFFDSAPPTTVYVASGRITCGKNGQFSNGGIAAYCWFVWRKGYKGNTVVKWFN